MWRTLLTLSQMAITTYATLELIKKIGTRHEMSWRKQHQPVMSSTGNGDAVKQLLILIPTFLEVGGCIASAKISLLRLLKMHARAVQNLMEFPFYCCLCKKDFVFKSKYDRHAFADMCSQKLRAVHHI